MSEEKEKTIDQFASIKQLLGTLIYEIDDDLKKIGKEVQMIDSFEKGENSETVKSIMIANAFIERIVKPEYTIKEVRELLLIKEKTFWQQFSQDEQEEIRSFLKNKGETTVYNSRLQLRHGIYMCRKCRNWLDQLEGKSEQPGDDR